MTRRSIIRCLAATCLATFLPGAVAWAGIQPEPFRTGLFGVTAGQTIRISIVNAGVAGGIIEPCARVWDAAGTLLLEADARQLPGGKGTFVDFVPVPDDGFPGGTPIRRGRAQLWAEVVFQPIPDDGAPPPDPTHPRDSAARGSRATGRIFVSLEVFDTATGRTVFTMPFTARAGINPQPFAPIAGIEPVPFRTGLFGVTAGQAIRVSVLNAGNAGGTINPCFRIWDAAGTLLADTETGPLPARGGTFVDFVPIPEDGTPGGAPVPDDGRVQLRAEVELVPAVRPANRPTLARQSRQLLLSLEVFDIATGRTVYTLPFAAVAGLETQRFRTMP